jgi:hypothetical protein
VKKRIGRKKVKGRVLLGMLREATSLVNYGGWLTTNLAFWFKSSKSTNQIVKRCDKLCLTRS